MNEKHIILFDTEYLTVEGALARNWSGPFDPDMALVQIGAVKVAVENPLRIVDRMMLLIKPYDRQGMPYPIDPYFTQLTGITAERVAKEGLGIADALQRFKNFCSTAKIWSWGRDEYIAIALSSFFANIPAPMPATQFDNLKKILIASGVAPDIVMTTNSGKLAQVLGALPQDVVLSEHDGLDDALSLFYSLRHLQQQSKLDLQTLS